MMNLTILLARIRLAIHTKVYMHQYNIHWFDRTEGNPILWYLRCHTCKKVFYEDKHCTYLAGLSSKVN